MMMSINCDKCDKDIIEGDICYEVGRGYLDGNDLVQLEESQGIWCEACELKDDDASSYWDSKPHAKSFADCIEWLNKEGNTSLWYAIEECGCDPEECKGEQHYTSEDSIEEFLCDYPTEQEYKDNAPIMYKEEG